MYVDDYGSFAGCRYDASYFCKYLHICPSISLYLTRAHHCSAAVDAFLAAQPGPTPKLNKLIESPAPASPQASQHEVGGKQESAARLSRMSSTMQRPTFEAVVFRKGTSR